MYVPIKKFLGRKMMEIYFVRNILINFNRLVPNFGKYFSDSLIYHWIIGYKMVYVTLRFVFIV